MSSRWISTSLRRPATSFSRLIAACAALTSDDLPMPRAPHSSALLAGRPRAKRWVFSTRRSRTRSIPRRSEMSTRLTRATGASAPLSARQMKASAASKSGFAGAGGARRSSASAMRRRRSAWLSSGGKGEIQFNSKDRGFATRTGEAPARRGASRRLRVNEWRTRGASRRKRCRSAKPGQVRSRASSGASRPASANSPMTTSDASGRPGFANA